VPRDPVTRFDKRGLPAAISRSVDGKPVLRVGYRYEFDEKGSWVRATRWQAEGDGEQIPVSVATRVIHL
jgi:hypothetical protein